MSVWLHTRKGRIVGEELSNDGTWIKVRLTEDAWADVRRRHRTPAGEAVTLRAELMVEMKVDTPHLPPQSPAQEVR